MSRKEKTIEDYLKEVKFEDYDYLDSDLFDMISNEGWLEQLEEESDSEFIEDDFEYIELKLTKYDKDGLINMEEETLEKFNDFDIQLKIESEYPHDTLDFIDYDKGIVYIIRLI